MKKTDSKVDVICKTCGKSFKAFSCVVIGGSKKYCSNKCRHIGKRNDSISTCLQCGTEFKIKTRDLNKGRGKYCSKKCSSEHQKNRVELICQNCGKRFNETPSRVLDGKGKYCSKKCFDDVLLVEKFERKCPICEKIFITTETYDQKYCSKQCVGISQRGELYEEKYKDAAGRIRWGLSVKERDKYICNICGSKENIEAHHILPYKTFVNERFEVYNGISLCENCHNIIHEFVGKKDFNPDNYPMAINCINIRNLDRQLPEEIEDRYI